MTSDKLQIPLVTATNLAGRILDALRPACLRIEIAGSIRRRKPLIGDIELCVIARQVVKPGAQLDLFAEPEMTSALELLLDDLFISKPNFHKGDRYGQKYKKLLLDIPGQDKPLPIDLFITTEAQWGNIFAIRTGSWQFSRAMVTQRYKGGLLDDDYSFSGGNFCYKGTPIPMPGEQELFSLLACGWLEPEEREIDNPKLSGKFQVKVGDDSYTEVGK